MRLVIYDNETVEISRVEDGYHRIRIWHNGLLRLMVDTKSSIITFVKGDLVSE